MKRFYLLLFLALSVLISIIIGCEIPPDSNDPKGTKFSPGIMGKTSSTSPSIIPIRARVSTPTLYESKKNMARIFYTFREYVPALDSGKIDGGCIYFTLNSADEYYKMYPLERFSSPKTIVSTFPFDGITTETYTHGGKFFESGGNNDYRVSMAYMTEGDWKYGIIGTGFEGLDGNHVGSFWFKFNDTSGDLDVRSNYHIIYTDGDMAGETYGVRSKIIGNLNEHDFFVHLQIGNKVDDCIQIVGKGVSRGTGHYVIYIRNSLDNDGYYLIPASADEAYFQTNIDKTPSLEYQDLTDDETILSYGAVISDYITGGGLYTTDLSNDDFAGDGLLVF